MTKKYFKHLETQHPIFFWPNHCRALPLWWPWGGSSWQTTHTAYIVNMAVDTPHPSTSVFIARGLTCVQKDAMLGIRPSRSFCVWICAAFVWDIRLMWGTLQLVVWSWHPSETCLIILEYETLLQNRERHDAFWVRLLWHHVSMPRQPDMSLQ